MRFIEVLAEDADFFNAHVLVHAREVLLGRSDDAGRLVGLLGLEPLDVQPLLEQRVCLQSVTAAFQARR
eukprot:763882-Hanusia_phi.AAC.2